MAEATTSSTPTHPRAVLGNVDKIPSGTENSSMLYIQRGMSQLSTNSAHGKPTYTTSYCDDNSTPVAPATTASVSGNTNADNASNSIDSALLAAMRDPRERVALLRLEQVMIDFINSSDGYLEVGGPYNSMVVTPNKINIVNNNTSGGNMSLSKPGEIPVAMPSSSMTSLPTYGYRPATSFQRCLLHRLADRFGILRETGSLMEGAIRLVKQKESKIPRQLLLNLPSPNNSFSELSDAGGFQGMPAAPGSGNGIPGMSMDPRDPRAMMFNSSNMQNSPGVLNVPNGGNPGLAGGKSNSKRKMKIMKRMSSGADSAKSVGSSSSAAGKGTPRSRKSKNFSEKEKAYAEARARIFNGENPTSSTLLVDAPAAASAAPTDAPPSVAGTSSAAASAGANPAVQSATISPQPAVRVPDYVPLSKPPSSASLSQTEDEDGGNVPAATTGMGVAPTKATWRNRRQEENDPDFQRGTLLTQPLAATATAATPIHPQSYNYYSQGGYPPQQPSYATTASDDYYSYSKSAGGRGSGIGGRGGRGFTAIQQSPRSPATFTNQYRYPKTTSHHYQHHHHHPHQEPTNLNCMEEFPALP